MSNPVDLTSYPIAADAGLVGSISNVGPRQCVERAAQESIEFGQVVVTSLTAANKGAAVKNIKQSSADLLFDADFVASNVINLSVNGVAIAPVTYATSHAATFAAVIAAIDLLTGVSAVAGSGRHIIITIDDGQSNITLSNVAVTAGGSQAGSTVAYSTVDTVEGIAVRRNGAIQTSGGDDKYLQYDPVSVLRKGTIWVYAVATVAYGDAIYAYADKANPTNQGMITNSSSGNLLIATGKVVTKGSSVGTTSTPILIEIEINLP